MHVQGDSQARSADAVFAGWLETFNAVMESRNAEQIARLFEPAGYWKDILSFTWEHRTFTGKDEIVRAAEATLGTAGAHNFRIASHRTPPCKTKRFGRDVIEAYFDFDTAVGGGAGFVRLVEDEASPQAHKIWLLLTTLKELRGFEEKIGSRRRSGEEYSKCKVPNTWLEDRAIERAFENRDPEVLIVGGGHAGLILGARLKQMGVDALIVEKTPRIGDVWRDRYHTLTLHNELTANQMPYLPFPQTWPIWLPKDMLAGWLEFYAESLELNAWTSTELKSAQFDARAKTWHADLKKADGTIRTIRCKHLVAAVGVTGSIPNIPQMPGLDSFRGEVVHSSQFKKGGNYAGKHAIVVGTGNSGHDVAQDLYLQGASTVHLMQRGPTCVVSLEPSAAMVYSVYNEGRPADDVDLLIAALPYPVLEESYRWIAKKSAAYDKELVAKLNAVGFRTYYGRDDTGFAMMYARGEGGFYINVGCSELIIDRKVGVLQADDVECFVETGLRLKDGTFVPCDLAVMATGFKNLQEGLRKLVGNEIADRVGPVWGFDKDFTMRGMWRRTAQDSFWIMGGGLLDARFYSRFLALEIKASLEGLLPNQMSRYLQDAAE